MEAATLTQRLKEQARQLGFELAGVCPAVSAARAAPPAGVAGGGIRRGDAVSGRSRGAYQHPSHVLEGARSLLMLGMNYRRAAVPTGGLTPTVRPEEMLGMNYRRAAVPLDGLTPTVRPEEMLSMGGPTEGKLTGGLTPTVRPEETPAPPGFGRVSCYARGAVDYHDLIHQRLRELADFLRQCVPGAAVRGVVDTAPLLEREFAQLAGLGWIGKNTLLINRRLGSWFFLAALLTDQPLDYDPPHATDHCGTCRACLDACPTQAFPAPYVLDATRCISYLTIELRGLTPDALRPRVGDWLFGCDVCQDVCPWNRRVPESAEPAFAPRPDLNPVELPGLFQLSDAEFRVRFRQTPLWRPKRRGLLRNAALVLGNQTPTAESIAALTRGLDDPEPLVREACGWALSRLRGQALQTSILAGNSRLVAVQAKPGQD